MAKAKKNPTSPTAAKITSSAGFQVPTGATNPPYEAALLNGETPAGTSGKVPYAILGQDNIKGLETLANLKARYGDALYPPSAQASSQPNNNSSVADENAVQDLNPTDPRLMFAVDDKTGVVVRSMSANHEHPLIDGMVVTKNSRKVASQNLTRDEAQKYKEFFGVPSIMNPNAYINLQGAGGKGNNKYLIERENQIRWYNATEPYTEGGVQGSSAPTVNEIMKWSLQPENVNKFPYRFTDFAFCKWWQKIPNNYLITLRRYPFPVNDAVSSGEEARGELDVKKLKPVATMLTFLGEDTGNKMSTILGPIETGLKWKDVKADIWTIDTANASDGGSVNNPAPTAAKFLGFLTNGGEGTKTREPGPQPPDPYNNGPYANKIIGPVNVIDSTKGRERGLEFKHDINLVFEYSLRSIGGINTKAAGLDIIANCMLMTSATAPFWGGANRFLPNAGYGTHDPFLGGDAGKAAWMRGDPEGFFKSLKTQFTKAFNNVSDLFNSVFSDPVAGLQQIAGGGAKEFMKMSTTDARVQILNIHSLLTGAPVGEWHITIGPPMNPMMMMGNMVCKSGKLEFNDELGPDDFPTEIKFTVSLEHGMPRDKVAIESMFNKGRGRIYALPHGYEKSFSSSSQTAVDTSYNRNNKDSKENAKHKSTEAERDKALDADNTNKSPIIGSVSGALYSHGYGYTPGLSDKQEQNRKNAKV